MSSPSDLICNFERNPYNLAYPILTRKMGACFTTTEAMRNMGCKTSGGCLLCNDRSRAETARHLGDVCSAPTEAKRKMGRVRSGGPHATSRPSRRRDLEPWAPAPQQPKPCGRWVARRPGDVCSATTEAERRPWTHGDKVRFRF